MKSLYVATIIAAILGASATAPVFPHVDGPLPESPSCQHEYHGDAMENLQAASNLPPAGSAESAEGNVFDNANIAPCSARGVDWNTARRGSVDGKSNFRLESY